MVPLPVPYSLGLHDPNHEAREVLSSCRKKLKQLRKRVRLIVSSLVKAPTVTIHMKVDNEEHLKPEDGDGWLHHYQSCTRRHPKYWVIRNKTLGVALLPVPDDFDAYYKSVNGKNSAAYYSRKAKSRGYVVREIDRGKHVDDLHEVKTSRPERGGRPIPEEFYERREEFPPMPNYRYWGVLDSAGKLVGFAWIAYYNEVAIVTGIMGHAEHLNDGVMYGLMMHVIQHASEQKAGGDPLRFIMYDTFGGAGAGMVMFKQKLGFAPYRVKWLP